MPNLIGACTRTKKDATIYMIHTDETYEIAENLEKLIKTKNNDSNYNIDPKLIPLKSYEKLNDVYSVLKEAFETIKESYNSEQVIELNYTGGTKVISSSAYTVFKKIFKEDNAYLTYLDGEQSLIDISKVNGEHIGRFKYDKDNETLPITIKDITEVHSFIDRKIKFDTFEEKGKFYKDAEIYDVFFEALLKNLNNRDEFIKFLGPFSESNTSKKEKIIESINNIDNHLLQSNIKLGTFDSFDKIVNKLCDSKIFEANRKVNGKVLKELNGLWLEKILFYKLGKLKPNIIDDVVCSLKRNKNEDEFEVDLIVLKNHRLFCISVTIIENYEDAKFKLFEIKLRASLLAGSEAKVAYVNLCENSNEFIQDYKDTWHDELNDTLIVAWDKLYNVEEVLIQWITGGDNDE